MKDRPRNLDEEIARRLQKAASAERARLEKALTELEQKIAVRLEALRINSAL